MSPSSPDKKRDFPVFSGKAEDFQVWKSKMEIYLLRKEWLGYVAVSDYNPTKSFVYEGTEHAALVKRRRQEKASSEEESSGDKGKKKQKASPKDADSDSEDDLSARVRKERLEVVYLLGDAISADYYKLVQSLQDPYEAWTNIVKHFGNRGPTEYARTYTKVFKAKVV